MDFVEFGSGSHFDARIALLRSLTELNQFLSIGLVGLRDAAGGGNDGHGPWRLAGSSLSAAERRIRRCGRTSARSSAMLDTREQVMACVNLVKRAGLDFLVLDQTRPDIEVPVVRVIVPGLRHFYRRFAPGRLYDVPVKLGWLDRPVPESELNPLLPQDLRSSAACARLRKRADGGQRSAIFRQGLRGHVTLEARANGDIVASFGGYSLALGKFSAQRGGCACRELRTGLPLDSFASLRPHDRQGNQPTGPALGDTRTLGIPRSRTRETATDLVVIEPQAPRLLAANAFASRDRHARAVALRLYAAARRRHGA